LSMMVWVISPSFSPSVMKVLLENYFKYTAYLETYQHQTLHFLNHFHLRQIHCHRIRRVALCEVAHISPR
jgi:hypothetical protein